MRLTALTKCFRTRNCARYDRFGEAGVAAGAGAGFQDMGIWVFCRYLWKLFSGFLWKSNAPRRNGSVMTCGWFEIRLSGSCIWRKGNRISHPETSEVCSGSGAKPGTRPVPAQLAVVSSAPRYLNTLGVLPKYPLVPLVMVQDKWSRTSVIRAKVMVYVK